MDIRKVDLVLKFILAASPRRQNKDEEGAIMRHEKRIIHMTSSPQRRGSN